MLIILFMVFAFLSAKDFLFCIGFANFWL